MPTIVTCPECQQQHRVRDESLGKRLKCSNCKHVFVAQADDGEDEEAPAPKRAAITTKPRRRVTSDEDDDEEEDEDEEDEDEGPEVKAPWRPWTREERVPWRSVRRGVSFVYYGLRTTLSVIGAWVIGAVVLLLLMVTSAQSADNNNFYALLGAAFITLSVILVGGLLVGLTLHTIGHVLFLSTPERPGTKLRTLAVTTASIWFVSLFFVVTGGGGCGLVSFAGSVLIAGPLFSAGGFVVLLPWFFSFWLYMRALAQELRDERLAREPFVYMIAFPVYNFVGYAALLIAQLTIILVGSQMSDFKEALGAVSIALILLFLGWLMFIVLDFALLIWGMAILQRVIAALDNRLGTRS